MSNLAPGLPLNMAILSSSVNKLAYSAKKEKTRKGGSFLKSTQIAGLIAS